MEKPKGGRPRKFSKRPALSSGELAELWHCDYRTILKLYHAGELEGFFLGAPVSRGRLRIFEDSAAAYADRAKESNCSEQFMATRRKARAAANG